MAVEPSPAVKRYGTDAPPGETRRIAAGPLAAVLEDGNLRTITLGGREAIRAISFICRDRNWATYAPALSDLSVEETGDAFRIAYRAECADAAQRLAYRVRIEGRADGTLAFEAEGEALTDWETNRTGFVVLHGVEGIAGAPVTVVHTDGSVEESRFPALISPGQPFFDIRALTHEVAPGLRVTCTMEGDAYEMEDQRNWTDASFKTYIRPLAKPRPYTIAAGERFAQSVRLSAEGPMPAAAVEGGPVTVSLGDAVDRPVPAIGLAVDPAWTEAALALAGDLAAAQPAFLACRFDPGEGHDSATMAGFARLADALGGPDLWLEAVVPCRDAGGEWTDDPAVMARDLDTIAEAAAAGGARFATVVPCPSAYLKSWQPDGAWPAVPPLERLYAETRARFPAAAVGGGMHSYFTELNRKPPPAGAIDFITHSTSAIVHAADDASVMETLEALPSITESARALAPGKGYRIGPSAIAMRFNPYGAGLIDNPDQGRTAMTAEDPRQRGLFNAAWTAGYVARAAAGGADAVTLSAPTGPFGIVHTPGARPVPWWDDAGDGARFYPVFHVVADAARAAAAPLVAATSDAPDRVLAIAWRDGAGTTVWLANLTPEPVEVRLDGGSGGDVTGGGAAARLAVIDEAGFTTLAADRDGLEAVETAAPAGPLTLGTHAVARLRTGR
ncbi:MAG: hypothetical protein RID91_13235 [Azospirillaceae bacterium]